MKSLSNILVLAVVIGGSMPALAQTARTGGGGGNAQQLQQLQQLASERTALQAENAKLKAELERVRKEQDTAKQAQAAIDQRGKSSAAALSRSTAEAERLQAELAHEKQREQELVGRFRETATSLRDVETDRAMIRQSLAARDQELKACTARNLALYRLNDDVLTMFEDQGFWASLASMEPFTQLKRTQNENLIDGYRESAQDQLMSPAGAPSKATP